MFAAETLVFPANIWKPGLKSMNIQGRGPTKGSDPGDSRIEPHVLGSRQQVIFSSVRGSQFLE
jgi:hypothetical protein